MFAISNNDYNIKNSDLFLPQANHDQTIIPSLFQRAIEHQDSSTSLSLLNTNLSGILSDKEFQTLKSSYGSKYANLIKARS
jgi:hypothetical protein